MEFKINTRNKLDYFAKVVSILSLVNPIALLAKQEKLLLTYLLYYNDKYKNLDIEDRAKVIFDKDTRIDISEALGFDAQAFYNNKSKLKAKGLIDDEYLVGAFNKLYYKPVFNINFILSEE